MMSDSNLPLLEEAALKLMPFLDEIVFVGGVTLGLLITDEGSTPRWSSGGRSPLLVALGGVGVPGPEHAGVVAQRYYKLAP
jgi:hypothetical protein